MQSLFQSEHHTYQPITFNCFEHKRHYKTMNTHTPMNIADHVRQLSALCEYSQEYLSLESCNALLMHIEVLESHLESGLQNNKAQIQAVLTRAYAHYERLQTIQPQLPLETVWSILTPIIPDRLEDLGHGIYEAKWWKPVPMNEVHMLLAAETVHIHDKPYEPAKLPGGLAVRFSIRNTPVVS